MEGGTEGRDADTPLGSEKKPHYVEKQMKGISGSKGETKGIG